MGKKTAWGGVRWRGGKKERRTRKKKAGNFKSSSIHDETQPPKKHNLHYLDQEGFTVEPLRNDSGATFQ